jgi:hypothetical protein
VCALERLVHYSSALVVLEKGNLLPQRNTLELLAELCEKRRTRVRKALEECPYLEPEQRKIAPLMIDHLLETLFDTQELRY